MQVQVSGKHVDVGDALRSRIIGELSQGIEKYFDRGGITANHYDHIHVTVNY